MAQQTILFTGATPTTLPAGAEMINDNFTELYGLAGTTGPCCGSKYSEFRSAIKICTLSSYNYGYFFYVSKIIAGALSGGHYTYTIEISVTFNFTSAGTVVLRYTLNTDTAPRTGYYLHALSEVSSSGYFGEIGINWSLLTLGTTYTCISWPEGALYAPIPLPIKATPPGGGGGGIEIVTGTEGVPISADGSKLVYVFDPVAPITFALPPFASIVGNIVLKNISTSNVTINGYAGTETFDRAYTSIILQAGENVELVKYTSGDKDFIVIGTYHTV